MYLKYKSLNDLLSRKDMRLRAKRRAMRRLRFDVFSYKYLQKMNMMKVASGAQETNKGVKVDFYTYCHLLYRYWQHLAVVRGDRIARGDERFAAKMETRAAYVALQDEGSAELREPYGMFKRVFHLNKKPAAADLTAEGDKLAVKQKEAPAPAPRK